MKRTFLIMLAVVALLLVGVTACKEDPVVPAGDASGWSRFRFVRVLVNLLVDGDATIGDDLTVTDDVTADEVTLTDDINAVNAVLSGYIDMESYADIAIPTAQATASPGVLIKSSGVGNPLEIRKASTPVFYVDVDGNVTYTGISSAGGLVGAAVGVRAPTAVGTATPGFFTDSTGGVSVPFEVRYNATPVANIASDGDLTAVDGTFSGAVSGTTLVGSSYVQALRKQVAKTGVDVTLSAAECSFGLISDLGDSSGITITLPSAVAGYDVMIVNYTGEDMILDLDGSDQFWLETNAAGDSLTNTTAYDYIRFVALDATGWVPIDSRGTWTDAN